MLGALLLPLLVACGPAVSIDATAREDVATAETTETGDAPSVTEVTCEGNQRSQGIYDYFTDASAGNEAMTPGDAARLWASSDDDVVVGEQTAGRAVVWLTRPDGTAHTRLELRRFEDGTWGVETSESCSDRAGPSSRD